MYVYKNLQVNKIYFIFFMMRSLLVFYLILRKNYAESDYP